MSGAAEIAPHLGIADIVVDLTSTGSTLKVNGLREVATVLESSARLVTRMSWRPHLPTRRSAARSTNWRTRSRVCCVREASATSWPTCHARARPGKGSTARPERPDGHRHHERRRARCGARGRPGDGHLSHDRPTKALGGAGIP